MEGNLSMKDSISFNKLPLSQAIRRLVGTKNFLMIYESSDSENNGKIKEIRIYNSPIVTQTEESISSAIQEKISAMSEPVASLLAWR